MGSRERDILEGGGHSCSLGGTGAQRSGGSKCGRSTGAVVGVRGGGSIVEV